MLIALVEFIILLSGGTFATSSSKKQHLKPFVTLWAEEHPLKRANLVDKLTVVEVVAFIGYGILDLTHNGKKQVEEDDCVEDNAGEEQEHLSITVALGLFEVETDDGTNEDLLPEADVLAQPLVFPVPEGLYLKVLIEGR